MEEIQYDIEKESLEDFKDLGISIIQKKDGYRYNSDSITLCNFVIENLSNIKREGNERIADFGSGVGIISIVLAKKNLAKKIITFEIQNDLHLLTQRNILLNKLENKIVSLNQDFTVLNKELVLSFDYIVSNPPYKKIGTGLINSNDEKIIARHEVKADLNSIAKSINYYLKPQGKAYLIYPSNRLTELITVFKSYHLEPKVIQFVHHNKDLDSEVFMFELIKDGGVFLKVKAPIFIK